MTLYTIEFLRHIPQIGLHTCIIINLPVEDDQIVHVQYKKTVNETFKRLHKRPTLSIIPLKEIIQHKARRKKEPERLF